jgi:hypothetical protein
MTPGTPNRNITRASKIKARHLGLVLGLCFTTALSSQTNLPVQPGTNISPVPGSNLSYRVKNPEINTPLVLKFKSFKMDKLTARDVPLGSKTVKFTNDKISVTAAVSQATELSGSNQIAASRTNAASQKVKKRGDDEALYLAGASLYNEKMYRQADEQLGKCLTLAPDGKFADDARLILAKIYFASNDMNKVSDILGRVVKKKNTASYFRVLFNTIRSNDDQAVVDYETLKQTVDNDTNYYNAVFVVREVFLRKDIVSSLIDDIQKVFKDQSTSAPKDKVIFAYAELLERDKKNRDMRKSWEYYNLLTASYPSSPLAYRARVRAKFINDNFLNIR